MRVDLSLAHEARIASLEIQLSKAIARIEKLEAVKKKPKPVPALSLAEQLDRIHIGKITSKVAEKHGVTVERMRSHDKRQVFMAPRWEAWALCSDAGFSTPVIGRYFGGRDHTTILHGIKKARALLQFGGGNG